MDNKATARMRPLTPTQFEIFTKYRNRVAEKNFRNFVIYQAKIDKIRSILIERNSMPITLYGDLFND